MKKVILSLILSFPVFAISKSDASPFKWVVKGPVKVVEYTAKGVGEVVEHTAKVPVYVVEGTGEVVEHTAKGVAKVVSAPF